MSDSFEEDPFAPARIRDPRPAAPPSLPLIAQYGLALVFVALATGLAFLVQHLISTPNVTLIYVLPVIISATLGTVTAGCCGGSCCFRFLFHRTLLFAYDDEPVRDLGGGAALRHRLDRDLRGGAIPSAGDGGP